MYTGKYLSPERSGIIGKSRDYNDYCCLCNEFYKFNNTGARMQDSIYHKTLKSYLIRVFHIKTSRFRHKKVRRFYGRQRITLPGNLRI